MPRQLSYNCGPYGTAGVRVSRRYVDALRSKRLDTDPLAYEQTKRKLESKGVLTTWGHWDIFSQPDTRPACELAHSPRWLRIRAQMDNSLLVPIALDAVPNMLAVFAGILINNSSHF